MYIAKVTEFPTCDICGQKDAVVDGKTTFGSWAYMCDDCFKAYGRGLGIGKGQILVLEREQDYDGKTGN